MCKLFCDPRIEIATPNNHHYHILKVLLVSPLARNGCHLDIFRVNHLGSLLLPYIYVGQQHFRCKNANYSGNVYFENGQTDRILVPYVHVYAVLSILVQSALFFSAMYLVHADVDSYFGECETFAAVTLLGKKMRRSLHI
jgi:hypothetical protein